MSLLAVDIEQLSCAMQRFFKARVARGTLRHEVEFDSGEARIHERGAGGNPVADVAFDVPQFGFQKKFPEKRQMNRQSRRHPVAFDKGQTAAIGFAPGEFCDMCDLISDIEKADLCPLRKAYRCAHLRTACVDVVDQTIARILAVRLDDYRTQESRLSLQSAPFMGLEIGCRSHESSKSAAGNRCGQ